jgi:beta-carotene hydroxylase
VIHDACHQSAHRNRVVNAILGHGSALMLVFAFPVFTRVHLQHHAHVNDPENDPDHYVSTGGPLWLLPFAFFITRYFSLSDNCGASMSYWNGFEPSVCRCYFLCLNSVPLLGLYSQFWFIPTAVVGLALGLFLIIFPIALIKSAIAGKMPGSTQPDSQSAHYGAKLPPNSSFVAFYSLV